MRLARVVVAVEEQVAEDRAVVVRGTTGYRQRPNRAANVRGRMENRLGPNVRLESPTNRLTTTDVSPVRAWPIVVRVVWACR